MRMVSDVGRWRRLLAVVASITAFRATGAAAQGASLAESFGAARVALETSRLAHPERTDRWLELSDAAVVCRRNVMDRSEACGGAALSARCTGIPIPREPRKALGSERAATVRSEMEVEVVFPKEAKLLALFLDYHPANSADVERGIAVVSLPRALLSDYRDALWKWGSDLLQGRMPPGDPSRTASLNAALEDLVEGLDANIGGTKRAFNGLLLPGDFVLAPQTRVAPDCSFMTRGRWE